MMRIPRGRLLSIPERRRTRWVFFRGEERDPFAVVPGAPSALFKIDHPDGMEVRLSSRLLWASRLIESREAFDA